MERICDNCEHCEEDAEGVCVCVGQASYQDVKYCALKMKQLRR